VHAYSNTGTSSYTVSLITSIVGGCSDTFVSLVTINPLPNSCDFEIKRNYTKGTKGFDFVPQTSNQKITYTWLLGDGNKLISNDAGVSYAYNHNKKYCVTMIATNESGCQCTKTDCITINTDIDEKSVAEIHIGLYPNPGTGLFTVQNLSELTIESIKVMDAQGKLLMTQVSDLTSVDLTAYADGIYMVELSVGGTKILKRVSVIK
jgi:hypothetical protein